MVAGHLLAAQDRVPVREHRMLVPKPHALGDPAPAVQRRERLEEGRLGDPSRNCADRAVG